MDWDQHDPDLKQNPRNWRLENQSRSEQAGSAGDGTVSELHTSQHHFGGNALGSQDIQQNIHTNLDGARAKVERHT